MSGELGACLLMEDLRILSTSRGAVMGVERLVVEDGLQVRRGGGRSAALQKSEV
jgi:hypothetical protein